MIAFGNLQAENPCTMTSPTDERIESVRAFNRFYTRRIGVLKERYAGSRFNVTESRLLREIALEETGLTAARLARMLDLDPGYLSRTLRALREAGLVATAPSSGDARASLLTLTDTGRRAFEPLEQRTRQDMAEMLEPLSEPQQQHLLAAMAAIGALLDPDAPRPAPQLRPVRPGDIGWMVQRHAELYAAEYGWTIAFEALVARIGADFIERYDPAREAGWIAERDGARLGCVFLVRSRDEATQQPEPDTAQLRLLLVEPDARGLGVGRRLVEQCSAFACEAGYRRIKLWTQSNLLAARAIYARAGYRRIAEEPHHSFGHDLVGEVWELELQPLRRTLAAPAASSGAR